MSDSELTSGISDSGINSSPRPWRTTRGMIVDAAGVTVLWASKSADAAQTEADMRLVVAAVNLHYTDLRRLVESARDVIYEWADTDSEGEGFANCIASLNDALDPFKGPL